MIFFIIFIIDVFPLNALLSPCVGEAGEVDYLGPPCRLQQLNQQIVQQAEELLPQWRGEEIRGRGRAAGRRHDLADWQTRV